MSGRWMLVPVLLALAAGGLGAQAAGQGSGAAPAGGPGEPEIVMPKVILEIEDLSVEKVEAQLPPEEDLLPPERKIPLLSEGELAVGEPSIPGPSMENETLAAAATQRPLAAEVNLGAGSQNTIAGSVSLKTLGTDPRFSMDFSHETIDGFSGHNPGSGYSSRNDSLDGGLKFRLGPFDTDLSGTFVEKEYGLQQQSSGYAGSLSRAMAGAASFAATPLDWLTLSASASGRYDSLTVEGGTPLPFGGGLVSPALSATARFGIARLGLDTDYTWRADTLGSDLHRYAANASFGLDIPNGVVIDARGGWFWNSAGLSLFPFSLAVTATPADFLTFSVDGGYKVVPYDIHEG